MSIEIQKSKNLMDKAVLLFYYFLCLKENIHAWLVHNSNWSHKSSASCWKQFRTDLLFTCLYQQRNAFTLKAIMEVHFSSTFLWLWRRRRSRKVLWSWGVQRTSSQNSKKQAMNGSWGVTKKERKNTSSCIMGGLWQSI